MHQQQQPSWGNYKLVSMKPKLQPVPEGGPSNGGPLNLMPLAGSAGPLQSPHGNEMLAPQLPPLSRQMPHHGTHARTSSADDVFADLDSEVR